MTTRILKLQVTKANLRHARTLYRAMGISKRFSGQLMPVVNFESLLLRSDLDIIEVEYNGQALRIEWIV